MDPELRQQLRVEDPMEEPELNLDGLPIHSIQVLLEPPTEAPLLEGEEDEEDSFYSPLDHFRNLVKLSMSSSQCASLEGFPPLPLLRSLHLADNNLSSGFEALAEADLQSLVLLDLSANNIAEAAALAPLDALENLQHLMLEGNPVSETQGYREAIFEVLPQLISLDSLDRDGTKLDVDEDALSSGDEGAHFPGNNVNDEEDYENDEADAELEDEDDEIDEEGRRPTSSSHYQGHSAGGAGDESEDIGSQDEEDDEEEYEAEGRRGHESDEDEESDVESGSERPMMGGKTAGGYDQGDEDEDLEEDEEEEDEDEEDEDVAQYQQQHTPATTAATPQQLLQQHQQQQQAQRIASGSEDEDDDEEEEEEEEENDEDEEEEEEEEEEAPGLAYLLADDIPDENDDEFEPEPEPEEESDMESSDEDEYGSNKASASASSSTAVAVESSSNNTNGHSTTKRPRSPGAEDDDLTGGFDHGQVESGGGFDVDGEDANGFGMASFDGPATFDDDSVHESKRPRT
ncbi:hypothetical protein BG015_003718 [Linnemannia schmuckeri]|uniref:Uncharacterized protein n=1 Tax=Linnemannia schmuckeri TaxID=64567 RepID=A0A9P5VDA2_9FUNG|nr:hypothetical protein BG015_003718 [Linnemannia schmuckeri]